MTVGEAIDMVLLRVNGGRLTQESSVQRAEIRTLLPVVMDRFLTIEKRMRKQESRQEGAPEPWDDGSFFGIYNLTPQKDSVTGLWHVDLPGSLSQIGSGAISTVYPEKFPLLPFVPAKHPSLLAGANGIFGDQVFYYPEANGDSTRISLVNYSGFGCDITVWALLSTVDLADTDQLPVPRSIQPDALEYMCQWFERQRGVIADNDKDDSDINEDQQRTP